MTKKVKESDLDERNEVVFRSESIEKLNKEMDRLRARLYTLAEASLPGEQQAISFKKAVKDYTSETWNTVAKLIEGLEKTKIKEE